jgi:hypothetical protein
MKINSTLKLAHAFQQRIIKIAGIECYHVSESDLEVGETYSFDSSLLGIRNPLNDKAQQLLEQIRVREFPEKPSRLTSFFCSPFKRSHWLKLDKPNQTLYKVEAMEPYHIADIGIIDNLLEEDRLVRGSPDIARQYWRGESAYSANHGIEIITPKIKILEKCDKDSTIGKKRFLLKKDLLPKEDWQRPLIVNPTDPIIITMETSYHLQKLYDKKKNLKRPEFPHVWVSFSARKQNSNKLCIIPQGYDNILKKDIFQKQFEYVELIE